MGHARSEGVPLPGGAGGGGAGARRLALLEIGALCLVTLLLIRAVRDVVALAGLPEILLAAVPILFMYAPVLVCRLRGVDSWDYPLALPAFRDRELANYTSIPKFQVPLLEYIPISSVTVGG